MASMRAAASPCESRDAVTCRSPALVNRFLWPSWKRMVLNWPASWASTLRAFDPMRRLRSWALLLLIPLLVSCSPSPRSSVVTGCADAQAACLQGLATVTMQTSQGEFTIEVNGDALPSPLAISSIW